MKTIKCLGILLVATNLQAQTINPATTNTLALPASTPYAVVSRDANSAVWQRQTYEIGPNGIIATNVDRYVELATGLNYEDPISGKYLPSKVEIDGYSGGAIAQYGQHKVIFANNLNTSGAIDLQTPDGKELRSDILGLSYYDIATDKSVLIAEVQDSQGQIVSSNEVLYPDAFKGIKASALYHYTLAGLEQDVILLTQLPTPESFGLSSTSCVLQVLTEFTAAPAPVIQASSSVTNDVLADEMLDFGAMKMVRGRAFLLGTNSPSVLISKQWLNVGGRTVLVESMPLASITKSLSELPAFSVTSLNPATGSVQYLVSNQRLLPSPRPAAIMKTEMKLALSSDPTWGFDLDLIFVNSSSNQYTFAGDNTYWVTGPVNFGSDVNFEGGSVIKYSANASLNIYDPGQIICQGTAYRPTVFTSKDDNSVGTAIGSGFPNGFYANPAIAFNGSNHGASSMTLHDFRISYALQAIYASGISVNAVVQDGQIVKCYTGFNSPGQTGASLGNVLFANVSYPFELGIASVQAYNSTFSHLSTDLSPLAVGQAGVGGSAFLTLENCILANIYAYSTNMPNLVTGDHNGFYNSGAGSQSQYGGTNFGTSPILANGPPFQSVGAGNYYLTNGCAFTNVGTTNIGPVLLAELRTKTVYPPILLTNTTISVNTNLSPQAPRDTGTPALGYHYDPIDYAVGGVVVTNAVLTVSPGTVIGTFNTGLGFGLNIGSGGRLVCEGFASAMNRIVGFNTAQEGSGPWSVPPSSLGDYCCSQEGAFDFRFTDWSLISPPGAYHVNLQSSGNAALNFRDCQFHGGSLLTFFGPTFNLTNCLFDRVDVVLNPGDFNVSVLRNNLFYGGRFDLLPFGSLSAVVQDNLFDRTTVVDESANYTYAGGNNAYVTNFSRLHPFGTNDIVLTNPPTYQSGPLGTFYQSTNSPLIHEGSTTADQVGLYFYIVTANEAIESTNIVSIGYHYVATDTNGNPLPAPVITLEPTDQYQLTNGTVTFISRGTGLYGVTYQWQFGGVSISGATNSTLTVTNVQAGQVGAYNVIVTDNGGMGSVTSSIASLYLVTPPVFTYQSSPTNLATIYGKNVSLAATAAAPGMTNGFPLSYQWQFNGTNINGATSTNYSFFINDTNVGVYSVTASNAVGTATVSWQATLTNFINVTNDLLLIYNTNSTDSATVLNYYLAHRPMVSGANVLGVGCTTSNETFLPSEYTNVFAARVQAWLAANPSKRPQYVILFPDIPSRINTNDINGQYPNVLSGQPEWPSVQYELATTCATQWNPFVTSINMNGLNGTNDCIAYINKLAYFATNYSLGKLLISTSAGGYGNTNFILDGVRHGPGNPNDGDFSFYAYVVSNAIAAITAVGTNVQTVYLDGIETNNLSLLHLTNEINVATYISWGVHSSLGGQYATNGQVRWSGNSGWWIIATIESYNGQRYQTGQGDFIEWFSSNAFGGTNYSNTPVGAITHVDEPYIPGISKIEVYFGQWAAGKNFGICAWDSRQTKEFQAVGDPFVTR